MGNRFTRHSKVNKDKPPIGKQIKNASTTKHDHEDTVIDNKMIFITKKIAFNISNSLSSLIKGYFKKQIAEDILQIIWRYLFEIDSFKAVLISYQQHEKIFKYEYIGKGEKQKSVHYTVRGPVKRDSLTNKLQIRHKILILGTAQTGKSTILKQLRFLYESKFTEPELLSAKPHINMNLIEAMRTLAIYSEIFKDQGKNTKVKVKHEKIREQISRLSDKEKFTVKHYKSFIKLYNDKGIKNTLKYCSLFQIIDTYRYLFDNMHKYCNDEYIPTMDDLLHHYCRTVGVNKIEFEEYESDDFIEIFDIFDCGGFRTERLKWKHFYDATEVVINVINLNGYYRSIWEDNRVNRLTEDIELFGYLINLKQLMDAHFIVFLNKFDLFCSNIQCDDIKNYHLDFKGDNKNVKQVIEYIINRLLQQVGDENKMRNIHFIATNAVSSTCIKNAFEYIRNDVIYLSSQSY